MSSAITDPDILAFIDKTEQFYPPGAVSLSIDDQRLIYDRLCAHFRARRPAAVAVESAGIEGPGGVLPIRRYWARDVGPARIVYFHGGGFVVGGLESHDDVAAELAEATGAEVISVDYRLCPEHPHPAAYDDALAAVDLLSDRPLVVAGDSAGGNLAAAVALARPHKIWGQVLIYPGLGGDARNLPSYRERALAPLLTTEDVAYYSDIRSNGSAPRGDPTFAPLCSQSFDGLPPCFISAAEHDPLRDDGPAYVMRLTEAGVAAEAVVEPELPHGHLRARHHSDRAAAAFARICAAAKRFANP